MQWDRGHQSNNVDDRRGQAPVGGGGMGAQGIFAIGNIVYRLFGVGGLIVAAVVGIGIYMCGGFGGLLGGSTGAMPRTGGAAGSASEDEQFQFVSFVLDDVQRTWQTQVQGYQPTTLVVFRQSTSTGCGYGQSATGPFYCPQDRQVYIDLSFYDDLARRFGAPGDFAQAYVIAHEVGHHLQHLMGTDAKAQGRNSQGANGASVRLELQADCYAGVWANSANQRGVLEAGDIQEGLTAASAIGDDRLQKQGGGTVSPETFSHGTSEQRQRWLNTGFTTGNMAACDTFAARQL